MWKKNFAYADGYIKQVTLGIEDVFLFDSRKMLDFWFAYRSQTNHWDGWLITFGCNGFTIQQFNRLRCPKQIKHFRRRMSAVLLECCLLRAYGTWFLVYVIAYDCADIFGIIVNGFAYNQSSYSSQCSTLYPSFNRRNFIHLQRNWSHCITGNVVASHKTKPNQTKGKHLNIQWSLISMRAIRKLWQLSVVIYFYENKGPTTNWMQQ